MFEQRLENTTATIFIESGIYQILTASNVGVNPALIFDGGRTYTYVEGLLAIAALDKASKTCPKYLHKRIRAQKMSFIFAFGPEMENIINRNVG
jgi:hypothetical protein